MQGLTWSLFVKGVEIMLKALLPGKGPELRFPGALRFPESDTGKYQMGRSRWQLRVTGKHDKQNIGRTRIKESWLERD